MQQRQLPGVALGEVRVVEKAGLRKREGLLSGERRDWDQRPVLGRLVAGGEPAAVALAALAGGACRATVALGGLRLPKRDETFSWVSSLQIEGGKAVVIHHVVGGAPARVHHAEHAIPTSVHEPGLAS